MKNIVFIFIIILISCVTKQRKTFIKNSFEKSIDLKEISNSEIKLKLHTQSNYIISVAKKDVLVELQDFIKKIVNDYSLKKEINLKISELRIIKSDTTFYEKKIGNSTFQSDFECIRPTKSVTPFV
jgi:hypothetical protein